MTESLDAYQRTVRRLQLEAAARAHGPISHHLCVKCGHPDGDHGNAGVCEVDGCPCKGFE